MLVIVILSAGMLVTMFLPAFHFNGNAVVKMYNKIVSKEIMSLAQESAGVDIDNFKEQIDEQVKEAEEKYGIKLYSITPGRIMVHNFDSFYGEISDQFEGMKSSYTMLRAILWILYLFVFVVLIVTILSFCLKWTKYIALGISTFYGLAAAVVFGIWQFLSPGAAAKSIDIGSILENALGNALGNMGSLGNLGGSLDSLITKLISCFWGVAFLIAFIVAVLLLIVSVVSMFVGNAGGGVGSDSDIEIHVQEDPERWRRERERQERERQERERQERERLERERKERERRQQAQKPVMGQVRCTKGIAMGQGFSLPQESKVVVGKSRQNANLLIQDPHVSNIHCSIRYQAATNSYIVKDHSSNGTFVNGVRLQKDVPMVFPAGTVLQLADGSNEITLG